MRVEQLSANLTKLEIGELGLILSIHPSFIQNHIRTTDALHENPPAFLNASQPNGIFIYR